MKLFFRLSFIPILIVLLFSTLFISIQKGYLNNQIKTAVIYYLKYQNIKAEITGLTFKDNILNIEKTLINLQDNHALRITNLNVSFGFNDFIFNIKAITPELLIEYEHEAIMASSVSIESNITALGKLLDYQISAPNLINNKTSDVGTAVCTYNLHHDYLAECNISIPNNLNISYIGFIHNQEIKGTIKIFNTPLSFYRLIANFLYDNDMVEYCNEHIKHGYITEGTLEINLDKDLLKEHKFTAENLYGTIKIADLELEYDKDFLPLKKTDVTVTIAGPLVKFTLDKAYIGDSVIHAGVIVIDYVPDIPILKIDGLAIGPASDLMSFILPKNIKKLADNNIDITKITGTAITNMDMIVPLDMSIKNKYNITTSCSDIGLKIFNDNIILNKAKINGSFDGKELKLIGDGQINSLSSNLNLIISKLDEDDKPADVNIKIQANLKAREQKYDLLTLISGQAMLNFEYDQKGDEKENIRLTSDLTNLNFVINKISMHKSAYQNAILNITNNPDSSFNFSLIGSNSLNITGNLIGNKDNYTIDFSKINYDQTKLKANITGVKNKLYQAIITGKSLDLSNTDIGSLFKSQDVKAAIDLSLKIDQVKLKNNINLTALDAKIICDKNQFHKGYLNAKIGNKDVNVLLKDKNNRKQWQISSNDAGSVFKGLGLYDNMHGGSVILNINTNNHPMQQDQATSPIEGDFVFYNFLICNNPFLTRLVSFMSLPGVASFFINNKNISFATMEGRFDYDGKATNIYSTTLEGPYMSLNIKGKIDTNKRTINLRGHVAPSLYGTNYFFKKLPLIGKLFPGKNRKGVILFPYSINDTY